MGLILIRFRLPPPVDSDHAPVPGLLVDRIEERTGARARREALDGGRALAADFPRLGDRLSAGPTSECGVWDVELDLGVSPYFDYHVRRAVEDLGGELLQLGGAGAPAVKRVEEWERPWQALPLGVRWVQGPLRTPLLYLAFVAILPHQLAQALWHAVKPTR